MARNDQVLREVKFGGNEKAGVLFHVVNDGEKWALKKESSQRSIFVSRSGTKQDVVRKAVLYLKNQGGVSLKIHNRDGSVQEERTYPRAGAVRVRG